MVKDFININYFRGLGYISYKYGNKILSLCREGWITRNNQPVNPPFPEISNRMAPKFQSNQEIQ